jgi:hypothetical protein
MEIYPFVTIIVKSIVIQIVHVKYKIVNYHSKNVRTPDDAF